MKRQKTKENGITLIALVISIIVMLILAGVSLNMMIGENGIITQAQKATYAKKVAEYQEEMETNIFGSTGKNFENANKITALNENVKQYIPSLEDNDVGKYGIVNSELYYMGDDEAEEEMCKNLGVKIKDEADLSENFASNVETSAVESILKNMTGDAFTMSDDEGNTTTLGVQLWDKSFANGNKWKIITKIEDGETTATYGTGWYYVEAGNTIEGIGILRNSYIINYTTRRAVRFDANKHTMLAYGGNLAVTTDLIFNADPSNLEKIIETDTIDTIGSKFGDNVHLYGYTSPSEVYNDTSFLFDGINDYISMESPVFDFSKGLTMSFYGNFKNDFGTGTAMEGVFGKWNSSKSKGLRLFKDSTRNGIFFSISEVKIPERATVTDNDDFQYDLGLTKNTNYCIDFSFNPVTNEVLTYLNGTIEVSDIMNNAHWQDALSVLNSNSVFTIGYAEDKNLFCKMDVYAIRVYKNVLTSSEILANYNATVSYHNILLNNGNASTGGNTGGEDINTINQNN